MFIKVTMLLLFFAVTVFIGFYYRKRALNVNDFVLAGRSVGPWLSAFAYGTAYFSAVIFVGFAGQFGWRFGMAATWIGIGNALIGSLLPWLILGRRTRVMTNHIKSATMPDFFGTRFNSKNLKIGASLIVFVFLIPYTASLYNGLSRLFHMAFGIDFIYCIIAMAVLTGVYVVAGGLLGTAVNNFLQAIVMLAGITAVIIAVLNTNGGLFASIDKLSMVPDAEGTTGLFTSILGPYPIDLIGVVLLTSLGAWGLPQMVSRFYTIKSDKAISKGAAISTIFAIIVAGGCYFIGGFGRIFEGVAETNPAGGVIFDAIIPNILSQYSDTLIGLVVLLVFAASMSTLSSLVMASSTTLTLDFIKGNIIKKMDDKKQLVLIRLFIVVFVAISALIGIIQYRGSILFIAQLMGISWGALAGSFLAPFLYGLYWKRANKYGVCCSFVFSSVVMVLNIFFRSSFPSLLQSPINAGAFTMLAGLVIVPVVSLLTTAPDDETVERCFACYDTKKLETEG